MPTSRSLPLVALLLTTLGWTTPAAADGLGSWLRRRPKPAPLQAPRATKTSGKRPADLVVLSDLHLAEGRLDGTWSRREQFRVHQEFDNLVGYLLARQQRAGGRKLKVVLDGDIFDFLLVVNPPQGETLAGHTPRRDHSANEATAVQKLRRIAQEHAPFFKSLRRLRAAGHDVVFTIGNHDQELFFPGVQRELKQLLRGGRGKLSFDSWFHLHGDVLVEHGQRYDPLNTIKYPLAPLSSQTDKKTGRVEKRLRPAAGTYLVTEWANRLRETLPEGLRIRGGRDFFQLMRRLPPELSRFVGFLANLSARTGPLSDSEANALEQGHLQAIKKLASDRRLLSQLNAVRQQRGQKTLDRKGLQKLLVAFDKEQANPYLRTKRRRTLSSRLRHALRMLLPKNLWPWLNARKHSTLVPGQRFALQELANVMVTGHTHHPYHYRMSIDGQRRDLVNAGSWAHSGSTDKLTFVDVRQAPGKASHVRLRRWDAARGRLVTVPAKRKRAGRWPGARAVH